MSESDFQQSVRYVQAMERECARRTDLNPRSHEVYRNLLSAAAKGAQAYMQAAGDFFAVRLAGEVDRVMAQSELYSRLGYVDAATWSRAAADTLQKATGYGDILTAASAEKERVKSALQAEHQMRNLISEYTGLLAAYGAARPAEKPGRRQQVREQRQSLLAVDAGFSLARIESHPPYRNSVYYSAAQLRQLAVWEQECTGSV